MLRKFTCIDIALVNSKRHFLQFFDTFETVGGVSKNENLCSNTHKDTQIVYVYLYFNCFLGHAAGSCPDPSLTYPEWDQMLVPHEFGIDYSMQHLTIVIDANMVWVIWVAC